jgi:hypothetical protein
MTVAPRRGNGDSGFRVKRSVDAGTLTIAGRILVWRPGQGERIVAACEDA